MAKWGWYLKKWWLNNFARILKSLIFYKIQTWWYRIIILCSVSRASSTVCCIICAAHEKRLRTFSNVRNRIPHTRQIATSVFKSHNYVYPICGRSLCAHSNAFENCIDVFLKSFRFCLVFSCQSLLHISTFSRKKYWCSV